MTLERRTPLRSDPAKTRAWKQRSARKAKSRKSRNPQQAAEYQDSRELVVEEAEGRCMAHGLHHPDCPGFCNVTHHILPREHGGPDTPGNLLPVWGADSGLDGCHGLIHRQRELAMELGYLRRPAHQPT